jgi:hypothetical protein
MKNISLREEKDRTGALTTFTVGLGNGGTIVLNEGTYYPSVGSCESAEFDEYVVIEPAHFGKLAAVLGGSAEPEPDALVDALAARLRHSGVHSLSGAQDLLNELRVPWARSVWRS